jgi:hypothetical protein
MCLTNFVGHRLAAQHIKWPFSASASWSDVKMCRKIGPKNPFLGIMETVIVIGHGHLPVTITETKVHWGAS